MIKKTNEILKRNRDILLLELNTDGKATVPLQELTKRGFDFGFQTSAYETAKGDRYQYCYDMGHLRISGNFAVPDFLE